MKNFSIILAADNKNGIGKNNNLAWKIKADLAYFRDITTKTLNDSKKNAVVMGRKTWDSIPERFRPLPDRINCILSRSEKNNLNEGIYHFTSLEECLKKLSHKDNIESIFIIGGANVYSQALKSNLLDKIYFTHVFGDYDCDVFFDGIPDNFKLTISSGIKEENNIKFEFQVYERR